MLPEVILASVRCSGTVFTYSKKGSKGSKTYDRLTSVLRVCLEDPVVAR